MAKRCHVCGINNCRQLIGLDENNREIYVCNKHVVKRAIPPEKDSGNTLAMFAEGAKKALGDRYYIQRRKPPDASRQKEDRVNQEDRS